MVSLVDIPQLEKLVVERLRLCALDIMTLSGLTPGVNGGRGRVWEYPPAQPVQVEDLPAVFHMVGETFEYGQSSRGEYISAVNYYQRWFLTPFAMGVDDLQQGHEMYTVAEPYFTRVPFYYTVFPRLATSTLPDLQYCVGIDLERPTAPAIQHSGLIGKAAPGGQILSCIEFRLPIVMKMNVRRT